MTRKHLFLMALNVALLLCAVWSIHHMARQQDLAVHEQATTEMCRRLIAEIDVLDPRHVEKTDASASPTQMAAIIQLAASQAELHSSNIIRIEPITFRNGNKADVNGNGVSLELKDVAMRQLLAFAHHLTKTDSMYLAKSIRLRAPREKTASELWNVEITLVQVPTSHTSDHP